MSTGWRYRVISVSGVLVFTSLAVVLANHPLAQSLFTSYVPLFDRLDGLSFNSRSVLVAMTLCSVVMLVCLIPLYKPRPRRILDTILLTHKRVLAGGFAIATFGFFQWTHRLPRATLVMVVGLLSIVLPLWFVRIRRRPGGNSDRTLIVGDAPIQIDSIAARVNGSVLGYLCPAATLSPYIADGNGYGRASDGDTVAQAGSTTPELDRLGGLSRIEDVLVEYDVDTVVLTFHRADRGEFFGALDACYEHGVDAKVRRADTDSVLISEEDMSDLVRVDLEPWDPLDYLFKRGFDVAFAVAALVLLAPVITVITAAIKLDSPGPVLYRQSRTAVFGESFPVYKFRSMVENAEAETGAKISAEDAGEVDSRVTRVGRVLRKTHLDEIPQLWSILAGDMSVVGPRPERPELDTQIQSDGIDWSKRWFVKPGLTGLAQINDVTGHEAETKLRYDLEYVRRQSFWFDIKIVIRQLWNVITDIWSVITAE